MATRTTIGSNAVEITLQASGFPVGAVDEFALESDAWAPEKIETGDGMVTPDGRMYTWGKNALKTGVLTLAPGSKIRTLLNTILLMQERNIASGAVAEPPNLSMTIKHKFNGYTTQYLEGVLADGDVDEAVGQQRLADRSYTLKFGVMIKKNIG